MSPSSPPAPHWADLLPLRPEVHASDGSVGELQMSLHKAVYQTADVPYRKVKYYTEITQPTPNLVGFFGKVARRLGTDEQGTALFHLDQGMGGGKSHALVGLFHMANTPEQFFATDFGQMVRVEAEQRGGHVDLQSPRIVTLTADNFSPGRPTEIFGPAVNLFERFVWSLTDGNMDRYHYYVSMGPNKETIRKALSDNGRPVLILLDELMDYVLPLSAPAYVATMPDELGFLGALMDACDDVPRVAFVLVMIRSEINERGYNIHAQDFREHVAERVVRNGTTIAVTESQDFASIIRRRLFQTKETLPLDELSSSYTAAAEGQWAAKVFDKMGANRGIAGFPERMAESYPFHPELMRLVQDEWSQVQGFQRVRSTVAIFARTAMHWVDEHQAGRWAPVLVGAGDIPLTVVLEELLSSGLLMNNDRAIQGWRAVAGTDITSSDKANGRAVDIDAELTRYGVDTRQPAPAVRMATALLCYSLVGRPQGRRGATKTELMASVFEPVSSGGFAFTAAEEVFNALTAEEGLGALEVTTPTNAPARYSLSIKQNLRMYFTAAKALIKREDQEALVWDVAQQIASSSKGPFEQVLLIDRPGDEKTPLDQIFGEVDSNTVRLVVLDPRRWTLLNGKDNSSRTEILALFGLGPHALTVDNAASCIVACVNTQQRDHARKRAWEVLAWRYVLRQINHDATDELTEARTKLSAAESKLKEAILKAYRHYAYLLRAGEELVVEFRRFEDDGKSALQGQALWDRLVEDQRATRRGELAHQYLATLLRTFDRALTPREVVQAFFKNPAFPLVTSTDEIRRAIYGLVTDDWELVDSQNNHLSIASPGQIQINSISQSLRPRITTPLPGNDGTGQESSQDSGEDARSTLFGDAGNANDAPAGSTDTSRSPAPQGQSSAGPRIYKRYSLEIANRSITSPENREYIWQLFRELAKTLDPAFFSERDHQLIDMKITLTTAQGDEGGITTKGQQAGARITVEDDDF
ncbi:DUF499 domain-containing protein [Streptomyces sp. SBT349]|uniref:DUF499 domain-containing protein n=1 Tax=Streptomyces sp. SBT349 TaxID=1580539 RepID=UPI00066EE0F6|nr:DUF499 domain-containing protein [Streptomyces sp. SBT349]